MARWGRREAFFQWSRAEMSTQGPRVVVLGGGLCRLLAAARRLATAPVEVTLVDRHNLHFQSLLYRVATTGLGPADVACPVRAIFRRSPKVRFVHQLGFLARSSVPTRSWL